MSPKSIMNEIDVQYKTEACICLKAQERNRPENLLHSLLSLAYCELVLCANVLFSYLEALLIS